MSRTLRAIGTLSLAAAWSLVGAGEGDSRWVTSAAAEAARSSPGIPSGFLPLVEAMEQEWARSTTQLGQDGRVAPHYLGYWLIELEHVHVEGRFGSLIGSSRDRRRFARTELRVGSLELDNSNYFSSSGMGALRFGAPLEAAPLDADPLALRRTLWLVTDGAYQTALELLEQKTAERKSSVNLSKAAGDFSAHTLHGIVSPETEPLPDQATLEQAVVAASRTFVNHPEVHEASVSADAWIVRRAFVTGSGVRSYEPSRFVRGFVEAYSQAADGMPLSRSESAFGSVDEVTLSAAARRVAEDVRALRGAALVDDYSGPVLFEGIAAPQLLHELLGPSLSGSPGGDASPPPWVRHLGKRVLPKSVRLFDDPTVTEHEGLPLFGGYAFDDEGVAAARVDLVEGGRLRSLLMSRTPNERIGTSNGHGRTGPGGWAQGAIANLVLAAEGGLSQRALRRRLLQAVAEEGGAYGLVVQALEPRNFATGGAAAPAPERLLRVTLDGREELVRGGELFELTARDLKDVLAVGNAPTGFSFSPLVAGAIPGAASVASPALLLEAVEVRRRTGAHELPPVLARPLPPRTDTAPP